MKHLTINGTNIVCPKGMTQKEIKEILQSIKTLTYYHKCAKEELKDIAEAEQLAAATYDRVIVCNNKISDKVPAVAEKLRDMYERHAKAWEERQIEYDKIGEAIEQLPIELQRIIKDRYIRGKTIRDIADKLYYGKSTIKRKEEEAIRLIFEHCSKKKHNGTNGTENCL